MMWTSLMLGVALGASPVTSLLTAASDGCPVLPGLSLAELEGLSAPAREHGKPLSDRATLLRSQRTLCVAWLSGERDGLDEVAAAFERLSSSADQGVVADARFSGLLALVLVDPDAARRQVALDARELGEDSPWAMERHMLTGELEGCQSSCGCGCGYGLP